VNARAVLYWIAAGAVIAYAFIAGVHPLDDTDVWWQLASGRYLFSTGHIARTEVFSYTAPGAPWIYPAGNGVIFYLLYLAGGFTLLSLLSAAAGAAIAAVTMARGGFLRCWLAALAVPSVAITTEVRANMFTTVLAACFLEILWSAENDPSEQRERRLWMLPALMLLWVNLHPGFVYGLAMVAAFAGWRVISHFIASHFIASHFTAPRRDVRTLLPVTLATFAAALVNPWGWRVYEEIAAQGEAMPVHRGFIAEWGRMPLSMPVLHDLWHGRDPRPEFWCIMALCAAAMLAGLARRKILGTLALAGLVAVALEFFRFQGLFAAGAVIIAPDLLSGFDLEKFRLPRAIAATSCALLVAFVSWRVIPIVGGDFYLTKPGEQAFATGEAAWAPERAAKFIEDHHLPREIYHSYSLGGFVMWRLAPRYPVFIDGRALPYGDDLFLSQQYLMTTAPDSEEWTAAFDHWKIRTILVSLDRGVGYTTLPIPMACPSPVVRLVYLDATAAVFVKADALTPEMNAPPLECASAPIPPLPADASRAARYYYWANLAHLYVVLNRPADAEHAIAEGRAIFDNDASLHFDLAQLRMMQSRMKDAENEFRKAVDINPTSGYWQSLGDFYASQERYNEARQCYWEVVAHTPRPYEGYAVLAPTALLAGRPKEALMAADRALKLSPFHGSAEALGRPLTARMMGVRGDVLLAQFDTRGAIEAFSQGVKIAPEKTSLQEKMYLRLADAYYQSHNEAAARAALDRANSMAHAGNDEIRKRVMFHLSLK